MVETTGPLSPWESFYVIVGSSGAALVGLQFIVITLISERPRTTMSSLNAFGTPTVVQFTSALLVSAIMSAPWHSLAQASVALTVCGLLGVVYATVVLKRAQR